MSRVAKVLGPALLLASCFEDEGPGVEDTVVDVATMGTHASEVSTSSTASPTSTTSSPTSTMSTSSPTSTSVPDSTGASTSSMTAATEQATDASDSTHGSEASTGDAGESTSTTGAPEPDLCPPDARCVPPAPPSWHGPFLLVPAEEGAELPSCPANAQERAFAGFTRVNAEDAACECSCQVPDSADCRSASATNFYDSRCSDPSGGGTITTSCSSLGARDEYWSIGVPTVEPDTGICTPVANETLADPMRMGLRSLCGSPPGDTCGGGRTCLPGGTAPVPYCIALEGERNCPPEAPFDQRQVIYTELEDTRGCSRCECGALSGTCTADLMLWSASGCSGGVLATEAVPGACNRGPAPGSGYLVITSVDASCPTEGGTPTGAIAPAGAVTLCCAPF